jgi:hypothetical protein
LTYVPLGPPLRHGQEEERHARVLRTIEGEIVPRLLMSSLAAGRSANRLEAAVFLRHEDVVEFARLLLSDDPWRVGAFIQAFRRDQVPLDRICLGLLAPAARELRELWEQQQCDFAQFAKGIERLLNVLQFVTESTADEPSNRWR